MSSTLYAPEKYNEIRCNLNNFLKENPRNQFTNTLKGTKNRKTDAQINITKSCGIFAYEVFQFLLLLVFKGKNLFRFLNSKHKDQAVSKNTYYRFLNETSYNWSKFLMLLAVKVTAAFDTLTRPERVKVLILDDSVIKRNRSKSVELLARVFDHVEHKFQRGFTLLTLGWSDGYSFIPTGFKMLSPATKSNRYNEVTDQNDQKTYGELFFMFCEDIQDMDLTNALQSLRALFVEHISTLSADITSLIKSKVTFFNFATFYNKLNRFCTVT